MTLGGSLQTQSLIPFFHSAEVVTAQCIINAILRQHVDYEGHALRPVREQLPPLGMSLSLPTTITINGGIGGLSPHSEGSNNICKQLTANNGGGGGNSSPPPVTLSSSNQANGGGSSSSSSSFSDFLVPPSAASTSIVNH